MGNKRLNLIFKEDPAKTAHHYKLQEQKWIYGDGHMSSSPFCTSKNFFFFYCVFVPVLLSQLLSVARSLLGRRGFSLLLRPTVYAQFVAGESESEIAQSMRKMSSLGLRPMLAVPIEEDLGESNG